MKYIAFRSLLETIESGYWTNPKTSEPIANLSSLLNAKLSRDQLYSLFQKEGLHHLSGTNRDEFRWPDEVIRKSECNCVENSVLMHYYFDSSSNKHHELVSFLVLFKYPKNGYYQVLLNHMIPFENYRGYWYSWDITSNGVNREKLDKTLDDSIRSVEDILADIGSRKIPKEYKHLVEPCHVSLKPLDFAILNKCYGINVSQSILLSHMPFTDQLVSFRIPNNSINEAKIVKPKFNWKEAEVEVIDELNEKLKKRR